ncbi:unnamed protein product [Closterium sp. NIES-53]
MQCRAHPLLPSLTTAPHACPIAPTSCHVRPSPSVLPGATPLSLQQRVDVAVGVLLALKAVQSHGQVHGDLKPSNVLLSPSFEARVVDWSVVCMGQRVHVDMGDNGPEGHRKGFGNKGLARKFSLPGGEKGTSSSSSSGKIGGNSGYSWGSGRSGSSISSSSGGEQKVYLLRCTEGHVDPAVHVAITPHQHVAIVPHQHVTIVPHLPPLQPVSSTSPPPFSPPSPHLRPFHPPHSIPPCVRQCGSAAATAAHRVGGCGMAWHGMAGQSRHGMAGMGWHRPTSPSSHYPLPTPHLPSSRSPLLPAHLPILFPYPWPPLFPHPQARQHAESGDISPLLDPLLPHPPPPPATLLPLFHLALACSSPSQSARPTPVSALDVVRLVRTSLLEGSQSGRGIGGENGEKGKGEGGRKGEKGEGGGGGRRDDGGENEGGGRGESGGEWSGVSIGESSEGVAEQSADNTRLPLVGAAEDSSESMV